VASVHFGRAKYLPCPVDHRWQMARPSPLAHRHYDFRHAGISWRLNAGTPDPQVAEWAGHSVEVLYRVYAHCIDGEDERWYKRMEELLASLKSASARQAVVVSWAELARWPGSHSAYIPGLPTFGGFWRHTAAQPFNTRRIVRAAQARYGLLMISAPAGFEPALTAPERAQI
jgi:hypothetical protein